MDNPNDTPAPTKPLMAGCQQESCCPSLDCFHDELVAYIRSMKGGERVMEMGGSCMIGETGTVEIRDSGVCIRWDTKFAEGSGMVTSFTGGARIIQDAIAQASAPTENQRHE